MAFLVVTVYKMNFYFLFLLSSQWFIVCNSLYIALLLYTVLCKIKQVYVINVSPIVYCQHYKNWNRTENKLKSLFYVKKRNKPRF